MPDKNLPDGACKLNLDEPPCHNLSITRASDPPIFTLSDFATGKPTSRASSMQKASLYWISLNLPEGALIICVVAAKDSFVATRKHYPSKTTDCLSLAQASDNFDLVTAIKLGRLSKKNR
jgi:hypothetical protein